MNNYLKKFNKDIEHIKLSSDERQDILFKLKEEMRYNPSKSPVPSFFTMQRFALASFAILLIGTTGAYTAEASNPGDILYPIKIHVNERVLESVALTAEGKAEVHISLIERRIEEMNTLFEEEDADEEKIDFIEEKIDEYTKEVVDIVKEKKIKNKEKAKQTSQKLVSTLEKQADVLSEEIEDQEENTSKETSFKTFSESGESEYFETQDTYTEEEQGTVEISKAEIEDILFETEKDIMETKETLDISLTEYLETEF